MIFTFMLAASMLTGMWALIILRGVSCEVLKHFNITAKFFCFQAVLLISNIQPFILKLAKLPCVLPYTRRGRIITLNYQIIIVEFFLISLLMRCLYRTKNDAEDLEDIERRNESKNSLKTVNTKTTLMEDKKDKDDMDDTITTSNGKNVPLVKNI